MLQWSHQIFCLFAFFQWNSMKWSGGSNITTAKHRAWPQTHRDQRKHNSDYNENKAEKKEAAAHSFATDKESTWIVSHDLVLLLLSTCVCSFFLLRILPDSFLTFTSCKRLTKKKKRKYAQSIRREKKAMKGWRPDRVENESSQKGILKPFFFFSCRIHNKCK